MNKKVIIGGVIAVTAIILIVIGVTRTGGTASAFSGNSTFNVRVTTIERGAISSYISASGVTEEVEKAEVFFETPLKVKKLLVAANQNVTKGQQLVELDMDTLHAQLEKLKLSRDTQLISMGSKLNEAEVVRARSGLESAQRAHEDAQKNFDKNKELYEAEAISKAEYEQSETTLKEAAGALETARSAYDTALSSKNIGDKTNNLNLKTTELDIEEIEKQITKINESAVSPIDGAIAQLNLTEGGYTSNAQPSFIIVNTDKVRVKANVREYDIRNVQIGQSVAITGDAIDKETTVNGKVSSISPVAAISRTSSGEETVIEVLIDVEKADAPLRPGLNITCDIYTSEKKDIIIAPMEVIKEDKDGNKFVFIVDEKARVMREKPVKTGITSDMMLEITEGLNEGDVVVLDPQPVYRDGSGVRITQNS